MKIIKNLVFALLISSSIPSLAQNVFVGIERGGGIGLSQYIGDLNPTASFKKLYLNANGLFKLNMTDYISIGLQGDITKLGFDDKLNNSTFEKARNLNFESIVVDAFVFSEFNFFRFQTGSFRYRWTPYLSAGLGAMYYNPYTNYQGNRYYLQPMGTEGQFLSAFSNRKYKKISAILPVAFGVKYWLTPGVNLAFEMSQKFTFTDYLDDVSATYVGDREFLPSSGSPDVSYYLQDRSTENGGQKIGTPGRQRGNNTDFDKYFMFQLKLTFIPQKYICPSN